MMKKNVSLRRFLDGLPLGASVKKNKLANKYIDIMTSYFSTSGKKSGVLAYEIGDDFIIVQFDGGQYKYSYRSCGTTATENMKMLALSSCGLNTYISRNNPNFEWKR